MENPPPRPQHTSAAAHAPSSFSRGFRVLSHQTGGRLTPAYFATLEKKDLSYYRPTGRLDPAPADLAYGSLELTATCSVLQGGELILLYEDETILWRFALHRAGWWRTA